MDSTKAVLTDDMKQMIARIRLCYVATVTPDGKPNLSPKGSIKVLDGEHLIFADIASPALAQGPLGDRAPIDPVAHSPGLEKLSIIFFPVRLIAEQLPLLPVQQIRQLGDVGYAGSGRSHCMHDTALVRSDVQLHPEVPVAALASLFISGSRVAPAFLVELGAAMMVASTMVPERSNNRRSPAGR
jgi:hypothetical protein